MSWERPEKVERLKIARVTVKLTSGDSYGSTLATSQAVPRQSNITGATLAGALASAINSSMGTYLTAAVDDTGGSVDLKSTGTTSGTDNYGIEVNVTDTASSSNPNVPVSLLPPTSFNFIASSTPGQMRPTSAMGRSNSTPFQQAYTTANQLVGWAYDASGDVVNNGLGQTFTYDAEGRISAVSGYTYVYSPEGERVSKQGTGATDYFSFGGREVARLTGGQWTDLIYGVSGLLAEVPGTQTGLPVYRMVDHLGTVVGTLNSSGVQLSSSDYAPFGQLFAGGTTDPYQFTGKERDAETGNDYFGARYLASNMGRFMSPDPGGVGAHPSDPQRWNMYGYSLNNPLTFTDPTGMYTCTDDAQTGGGCSSEEDKKFANSLQDAKDAVRHLSGSDWADAMRGLAAYGEANQDNGVHITIADPKNGASGNTAATDGAEKTALNPTGQSINTTIGKSLLDNGSTLDKAAAVAHEGSHIADAEGWAAGGFINSPTNLNSDMRAYGQTIAFRSLSGAQGLDARDNGKHYTGFWLKGQTDWVNLTLRVDMITYLRPDWNAKAFQTQTKGGGQ